MNTAARALVVGLIAAISVGTALAQSEGPNSPVTVANDASIGVFPWGSPGNAVASDDVWAFSSAGIAMPTNYLKATDFGFSIPGAAIILGIEVSVEKHSPSGVITDNAVRIVKGGAIGSADRSDIAVWLGGDTVVVYGSATDLWGETWSPADINGSGFGAAISAQDGVSGGFARVDHISITVYYSLCGDTLVSGGEDCDDGNTAGGDCCSSTCAYEVFGSPCLDGTVCNGAEACDGAGTCSPGTPLNCNDGNACTQDSCNAISGCVNTLTPKPSGCRTAAKNLLVVKDNADDTKDKLIWKWIKGQATTTAEFGVPTGSTSYTLCLYAGTTSAFLASAEVPPDAVKWQPISTKGFKYKDSFMTEDGIQKMVLKSGVAYKAKAIMKGKGGNLPDPTIPFALPVTAQLLNDENPSLCLEGVFSSAIKNASGKFKAKAP